MKKFTYFLSYLLTLIFITSCNEPYLHNNSSLEDVVAYENFSIKEGVLNFNSRDAFINLYEGIKKQGAESFFYKEIKNIPQSDFKPLRPYFKETENSQLQFFLINKKDKLDKAANNLHKGKIHSKSFENEVIELDDYVITDSSFAVLLNEDREIVVNGILYRYQGDGVFVLDVGKIIEFRSYMEGDIELNNNMEDNDYGFREMNYLEYYDEDHGEGSGESSGGGSGGGGSTSVTEPDFNEAKLNFEAVEFSKNPSLWGDLFGYSRTETISVPDNKRVKLQFWNRNYIIFKSFGAEIRFQKRVSFLGISGWQKSYPSKIAMGVNSLQYNYEMGPETLLNSSILNPILYSFSGVNYYQNGQISNILPPMVPFPVHELLGGTNGLNVFIKAPFINFEFEKDLTPKEYANILNSAGSDLIKTAAKQIPKWINAAPNDDTTLLVSQFYKNGTSLTINNKNWRGNVENNITKYFDVRVPTLSMTVPIGDNGNNFFGKPEMSSLPKFSLSNYKTGSIDFYGAVLYKNIWYGKRMISNDFDK